MLNTFLLHNILVYMYQVAKRSVYRRHILRMRSAGQTLQFRARLRMRNAGPPGGSITGDLPCWRAPATPIVVTF